MKLRFRKPEDHLPMPKQVSTVTIGRVEVYDAEGHLLYRHRDYRTLSPGETYMIQVDYPEDEEGMEMEQSWWRRHV